MIQAIAKHLMDWDILQVVGYALHFGFLITKCIIEFGIFPVFPNGRNSLSF
jgi:hypothetical protein